MRHPLVQQISQVVFSQRDHEIQAFPPQRAQQTLTQGIGLGTSHWGFEDLQPQVAYTPVELLGEDRIAVMNQEPVSVIRWARLA